MRPWWGTEMRTKRYQQPRSSSSVCNLMQHNESSQLSFGANWRLLHRSASAEEDSITRQLLNHADRRAIWRTFRFFARHRSLNCCEKYFFCPPLAIAILIKTRLMCHVKTSSINFRSIAWRGFFPTDTSEVFYAFYDALICFSCCITKAAWNSDRTEFQFSLIKNFQVKSHFKLCPESRLAFPLSGFSFVFGVFFMALYS